MLPRIARRADLPRTAMDLESPLSTRSFIARPIDTGYSGIYVHLDGAPSHHLPLLLAAYQHKFGRNLQAMTRYLIDDVAIGWAELGTDLLDAAPLSLVAALTGGAQWPSRTLNHLITPDGSPPVRMTVTEDTAEAQDLQWGYVLHEHGIEVISLFHQDLAPIVEWSTDPRTHFSDQPERWFDGAPAPVIRAVQSTLPPSSPAAAPSKSGAALPATR